VLALRSSGEIFPFAQSAVEFWYVSNGGLACDWSMLSQTYRWSGRETSGTRAAGLGQSLWGHSPPWPPILRSRRAVLMPIMKPATTSIKVAIMIKKNTDVAAWGTRRNSTRQAMNTSIDRP
jgi:hypothetical protein